MVECHYVGGLGSSMGAEAGWGSATVRVDCRMKTSGAGGQTRLIGDTGIGARLNYSKNCLGPGAGLERHHNFK
jgi:hypothetical protein